MAASDVMARAGGSSTASLSKLAGLTAGMLGLVTLLARWRHARRLARISTGTGPGVVADDGVLLHVETDGPQEAPRTVLLAHGFSADMSEYDTQRSLLRNDFKLVFFDQRGHGRSGWGGPRFNTVSQLGRDLGQVLDECTSGPVVIVGHSLGGMALMALARERPELFGSRVVAAALISTSAGRLRLGLPPRLADVLFKTGALRAVLWLVWFVAPLTDRASPLRTRPGQRVLRHFLFGLDAPSDALDSKVQQMLTSNSRTMAAAFYPGMLGHDTRSALTAFSGVPSLVLTGDADATIPAWHSDRIAEAIGNGARLVHVPHAGHMVNLTHADAVNDALRSLMDEAIPSTTSRATPGERP